MRSLRILIGILNHPLNKRRFLTFFKILWWKVNQLFFHLPAIIKIQDNIQCICYPESSYGGTIVYSTLPEYPEMVLLLNYLKPSSIFFDIGANMGMYSLLAASKITKGKIYAFEPNPKILDILYQNIKLNSLEKNIEVVEKVVSDKNGSEMFSIQHVSEYSHISYKSASGDLSIPSVKLDNFCKNERVPFIDMIKIDVEGAEIKVLKGLERYLKNKRVELLIVELSGDSYLYGSRHQETINYLNNLEYLTFRLNNKLNLTEIKLVGNLVGYNIIAFLKKDKKKITKRLKSAILNS